MLQITENKQYPLIILGAGASLDYISESRTPGHNAEPWIPPSTDDLFASRFELVIKKFKVGLGNLPATIATELKSGKKTLEQILKEIKENSVDNPEREKELIALEFYLQNLFVEISNRYGESYGQSTNNYRALIGKIKDKFPKGASILTFNYDTLLEQSLDWETKWETKHEPTEDPYALPGNPMDAYINGRIKVTKIHGSCNWRYRLIEVARRMRHFGIKDPYQFLLFKDGGSDYFEKEIDEKYISVGENLSEIQDNFPFYYRPAIAIPLPEKSKFICPKNHIEELKKSIKNADRILIIGWKARESHTLELLEENLSQLVPITIVSSSKESAERIKNKIAGSIKKVSKFITHDGKFSDFFKGVACIDFFQ